MRRLLSLALLAACSTTSAPTGSSSAEAAGRPEPTTAAPSTADGDAAAETPAAPAAPAPTPRAVHPAISRAMGRHDEHAERARAAVVAGDLAAFHAALDAATTTPLPGEQAMAAGAFVDAVRHGQKARDLGAAAAAVGAMGAACAGCHAQVPATVRYPASGFEDEGGDVGERMMRHWWSVEALWQGLVGPSEQAWTTGASTLAATDLTAVTGFPQGEAAAAHAQALQAAAGHAASAEGAAARGEALGSVLATCAACHEALGQGPGLEE